jgi:GH25 family lysozyme M1 (1,4-beta-N-acetylmuramidase)
VKGIDVSYYQSNIDWARVKADGVEFAFIRVSDGTGFSDPKFQRNWDGAKANGVRRGAYQFFRSNQNPEAQADLLADAIGQLEPGDLPPVIDVESTDGQSASTIRAKVQRWLDRVEARLGVRAIIYTGAYFWRDQAGGGDFAEYPLWIAHYGTLCPLVPPTWSQWTFHQHTSSGRVQGISGNVDMNVFNGTRAQLAGLAVGGSVQEPPPPPTSDECAPMEGAGSIIDDGSACFFAGGDPRWLKKVTNRGQGGDLISTGTTSSNRTENFAEWTLNFQEEGTYEIEAYIDDQLGTSRQARYRVTHADGTTDAVINQYASVGFVSLGAYHFRAGAGQKVRLNDNTGESSSLNRDLVFDAIRVTRLDDSTPPPAPDTCARLKVTGTNGTLNIRPQPNTQLAAIGTVDEGDVIDRLDTVTGQAIQGNTTWHKITDGTVTGFVTDVFVTCVP